MKRRNRQRIMISVLAGFLALLMLLPMLLNILVR